jgi:hypothetical protein
MWIEVSSGREEDDNIDVDENRLRISQAYTHISPTDMYYVLRENIFERKDIIRGINYGIDERAYMS